MPGLARDVAGERTQGGDRALERAGVDAFRAPRRQKGAQVRGPAIGEIGDARRRAEALPKEGEKLPGVTAVRVEGVGRDSPLVGEMAKPGGDDRRKVGRGWEGELCKVGGLTHEEDGAGEGLSGGCASRRCPTTMRS